MSVTTTTLTQNVDKAVGEKSSFKLPQSQPVDDVDPSALTRLEAHADDLRTTAMKLTDSWGQAMFIMEPPLVEKLFSTLGFSAALSADVYKSVCALAYVRHEVSG